jgi:hypothetical protein
MTPAPVSRVETAEFLTLAEAAKLAGRSYSWARERAIDGRLDRRRFGPGRVAHVTADSLMRAIAAEKKTAEALSQAGRARRGSHLRLVVNNDKN